MFFNWKLFRIKQRFNNIQIVSYHIITTKNQQKPSNETVQVDMLQI